MKKLLFAAAAVAAGIAVADVTSANIVGYAPTALPEGNGLGLSVGSAFTPVSAEKVDLMDISVTGYTRVKGEDGGTLGDIQVQTVNQYGGTGVTYVWIDYEEGGESMGPGWFDPVNDYAPLEKDVIKVAPGEGLWAIAGEVGFNLQSAGQVPITTDVPVALAAGNGEGLTVANPTPVKVDLVNCYVTGYTRVEGEDGGTLGDIQVQTLNPYGGTDRTYVWIDYEEGGESMGPGWFDPINDYAPLEANDITPNPGEGLWTVAGEAGFYFCWPKVDLN